MSDKELLIMAAKAAGLLKEYCGGEFTNDGVFLMPFAEMPDLSNPKSADACSEPVSLVKWNPLKDDGAALRLAVKLNLLVDNNGPYAECFAPTMRNTVAENHNGDPCAATRRAIVRAAAEIGGKL